jgi:Tol biopolymer transport system component
MRNVIPIGLLAIGATTALLVGPAAAKVPGENGRIVFDADDGPVYTVEPDGSDLRQVAFGHDQVHWSSDGSRLAMDSASADDRVSTALANADGSGLSVQTIPDPTLNVVCPVWAPGDARLACEVWDDVHPERLPGIFTIHASGWDMLQRVTTNTLGGHDIAGDYSPDGSRLAFLREDAARRTAVHVVDLDTGAVNRVSDWFPDSHVPSWSPNGRRLLYDNARGGLLTARPDGSRVRRVPLRVPSRSFASQPGWSPDGRRIVFSMFTARGPASALIGIYTAAADGTDVRPVATTTEAGFSNPDWGPRPGRRP